MTESYNQHHSKQVTDITAGSIDKAQQCIYNFFLAIIKRYQTEEILNQFNRLFIKYEEIDNINAYHALGEIIFHNKEHEFKNTLIRCCYILNNNWIINGNTTACQKLPELFLSDSIVTTTRIHKLKKLRQWLQNFVQSQEYNTLRSLSGRSAINKSYHSWNERFSSYLLISEYADASKPLEQRQYAEALSRKIKKQFKFDLAMYTARIDSKSGANSQRQNPTNLGDGVLTLIKKILNRHGDKNYRKSAKNFYNQIDDITFLEFKKNLLKYLDISQDNLEISGILYSTVVQKLNHFQKYRHQEEMTLSLLTVTCSRILRYLLLNESRKPSEFLKLSLEYNNYLNPVILLLKIVLIYPNLRFYLESCVAELIKFYSSYEETECWAFINFLDVLNVTLAVFDEDTNYSLVKMNSVENDLLGINLEDYRVFSQAKKLKNLVNQSTSQENETKTLNF